LLSGESSAASRAPEPNEIFWENIGIPAKKLFRLRILSFLITLLVMAVAFGIFTGLNVAQVIHHTPNEILSPMLPILMVHNP
jgi:hypothetical protein